MGEGGQAFGHAMPCYLVVFTFSFSLYQTRFISEIDRWALTTCYRLKFKWAFKKKIVISLFWKRKYKANLKGGRRRRRRRGRGRDEGGGPGNLNSGLECVYQLPQGQGSGC